MKPILSFLLLFLLLYIISDIFVKSSAFGITPKSVNIHLFGDEDEFIDPLSKSAFLEFWHMEIFFMMMILLTLSAIFIRVCKAATNTIIALNILMISAMLSLVSIALAFFVSEIFTEVYLASYWIWHLSALYMIVISLWRLHYDTSI